MQKYPPAILFLDDGRFFYGYAFGAIENIHTSGEVCFNTGMTGYQEILTDPSYCGQIVTMTAPQIGNTGINPEDVESDHVQAAGFVVRDLSSTVSNWRATLSLEDYLAAAGVLGITDVDIRSLTRHIRDRGAMNGLISVLNGEPEWEMLKNTVAKIPSMKGLDLVQRVTCESKFDAVKRMSLAQHTEPKFHVLAVDFGIKTNILRQLHYAGCRTTIIPATTVVEEILALNPDGIFLSNGPGDPAAVSYGINLVKALLGECPIFGICLGHQLLALALGAKTYKLPFGHRGANHPVQNLETKQVLISSHNHGFAVDAESLPATAIPTWINLNDQTLEGFRCSDIPATSIQFHPEASPGPHDGLPLFQPFIKQMRDAQTDRH